MDEQTLRKVLYLLCIQPGAHIGGVAMLIEEQEEQWYWTDNNETISPEVVRLFKDIARESKLVRVRRRIIILRAGAESASSAYMDDFVPINLDQMTISTLNTLFSRKALNQSQQDKLKQL